MPDKLREKLIEMFDTARQEGMLKSKDSKHSEFSDGDADGVIDTFKQAGYRLPKELISETDEQMVEEWAGKIYACGEPADELEFKLLSEGHKNLYRDVARQLLSNPIFKAREIEAEKRGIKEVVEWIQKNRTLTRVYGAPLLRMVIVPEMWQAQCKDWGIQEATNE